MRIYIVLLLITGTVWAQTGLDKLVLKDGTEYLGEFSKKDKKNLYFKPEGAFAFQPVSIKLIQTLLLEDGTFFVSAGKNLKLISTIEGKAVYDAKKDAKKWKAWPIAIFVSGGSTKLNNKTIVNRSNEDIELYVKTYSKKFKDEVFINIIIGSGLLAVTGLLFFMAANPVGGSGSGMNCGAPCGESIDIDF